MNIFLIPSWYPSDESPLSGIFSKEQAMAVARKNPDYNFGISLWGQQRETNLLWAKDHFKNILKLILYRRQKQGIIEIDKNYQEFYTPALTWTISFMEGNMANIIIANEENLLKFENTYGKVALIHAHVAFPAGYIAMKLAEKYRLPYIITEHMSPFPLLPFSRNDKIFSKIKNALRKAQCVISVSPHARADIEQQTDVKAICIPNQVNEDLFSPSKENIQFPPFIFFTLCGLVPQKGIPDLLKAIALLKHPNAVFRIGGSGENKEELQELADALKVSRRIQWLGELTRTEAAKEFQQCHAFVLPSLHESMGVVYAEAIACGKPIIATRCGGPEFIVTPDNGVLVDVDSPQQLADAMDHMVQNYNKYNPDIIRKDFMDRFSSKVITEKIVAVYEAVASKKPLPAEFYRNE